MKPFWISALLLLGMFALSLAHGFYISSITEDVIAHLEAAHQEAEQGNWDLADGQLQSARQIWEEHSNYLHITLQHKDMDSVDLTFQSAIQFLESQQEGEFSASNAQLIELLALIKGAEQLSLQNVL